MRQLLWAALLTAGCVTTLDVATRPTAWGTACDLLEKEANWPGVCEGIEEPTVVVTMMVMDHPINLFQNLRGIYYNGEPYVFVRAHMTPEETFKITVHEMVHYIMFENGEPLSHCMEELLARRVDERIDGVYDETWPIRYGCEDEVAVPESVDD